MYSEPPHSNRKNFYVSTVINPILVKIIMIKLPVTANITAPLPMAHALPSLAYKNTVLNRKLTPSAKRLKMFYKHTVNNPFE